MSDEYEDYQDSQGRWQRRKIGQNQDTLSKEKLQDASGLGSRKVEKPVEETDPDKMSTFQRAAYMAKKARGESSPTAIPTDEPKKKRKTLEGMP